jgi:hypothetical protein
MKGLPKEVHPDRDGALYATKTTHAARHAAACGAADFPRELPPGQHKQAKSV